MTSEIATCSVLYLKFCINLDKHPTLAQLVERRTVVYADKSLGRWFESGRSEYLFLDFRPIALFFLTTSPFSKRHGPITLFFLNDLHFFENMP
jgi:hypothetical protein